MVTHQSHMLPAYGAGASDTGAMACSPSNHWLSVRRTTAPAGNQPPATSCQALAAASRMGVPFQSPVTGLSWRRSIQPSYPSGKRTWTQSPRPSASSVTVSPANTSLTHSERSDASARSGTWLKWAQASPNARDMVRPFPTPRQRHRLHHCKCQPHPWSSRGLSRRGST